MNVWIIVDLFEGMMPLMVTKLTIAFSQVVSPEALLSSCLRSDFQRFKLVPKFYISRFLPKRKLKDNCFL